ncbi:MAG: XdhC family protein [Pseudomonadota bacterium]
MMHDALENARDWLATGESVALATVVGTWGSSPVPAGGQMAIATDERFSGSVSGGCVEADVIVAAAEVRASGLPRLLSFGVADETAWRAGLPCGGNIEILLERLAPGPDLPLLDRLLEARQARVPLAIRTSLADGAHTVLVATPALAAGAPLVREGKDSIVHVVRPPPRIVVVGATHIAQHLAVLAAITGYEIVVVDPRPAFASDARWSGRTPVVDWPASALAAIGLDVSTAVVALSHAADIDDEALLAALASPAIYVGALGSTRNHARRSVRLAANGCPPEAIARIHAPIGLDIGARTPAEIALAILAEITLAFNGPRQR